MVDVAMAEDGLAGGTSNSVQGRAGSLSRFALAFDYLYAVNERELVSIDLSTPKDPR